jgi:hypothetical protein
MIYFIYNNIMKQLNINNICVIYSIYQSPAICCINHILKKTLKEKYNIILLGKTLRSITYIK